MAQTIRAQGRPWPGMNTRGGRLDDGAGWLEDGSKNVEINHADVLAKRSGMVRGLDEWFGSVVCGLFTYLDYCGNEWLLVADEDGINIRQPFVLPVHLTSDSYPNDTFDGNGAISTSNWRNELRYIRSTDSMIQATGAVAFTGSRLADALFMRWFKDAGSLSYQVVANYIFDPTLMQEQRVGIVIRGNGDLSTGALLQCDVIHDPSSGLYEVLLLRREQDGTTYRTIERRTLTGSLTTVTGTVTLRYERDGVTSQFVPVVTVLPNLGPFQTVTGASLTTIQDLDLGLTSGLAVAQKGGTKSNTAGVQIVIGGAA